MHARSITIVNTNISGVCSRLLASLEALQFLYVPNAAWPSPSGRFIGLPKATSASSSLPRALSIPLEVTIRPVVLIDTPPVAIVSDALTIMPLVDGWMYSIYFNKVRRKAAEFCVKRLLDINVPAFGAILNGLTGGMGGYYYSHYYAKSYKDYYVTKAEEMNGTGIKISEPAKKIRK